MRDPVGINRSLVGPRHYRNRARGLGKRVIRIADRIKTKGKKRSFADTDQSIGTLLNIIERKLTLSVHVGGTDNDTI